MKAAYITDYQRSPVGKYGGKLSAIRPDDLAAYTIQALLTRNPGLDPAAIDEVILGCANQSGEDNRNVARFAALRAGLPVTVPAYTVNRLCASGMQSAVNAFMQIGAGLADVVVAGGVESMSRAPFVISKAGKPFDRGQEMADTTLGARFYNPEIAKTYTPLSMGETAEQVADRWQIEREAQDRYALQSHQRYLAAHREGKFAAELMTVPGIPELPGAPDDEAVRTDTSLEKLAALRTAFRPKGTVTAGNAGGINDGASAMLIASEDAVARYALRPLVRIVSASAAGVHPDIMGTGPIPAIRKLLAQTGLTVDDIDLFEINEAFAAQVLCCAQELGIAMEKLNVNGGAIAIGHPLGCSGNRITGHLALELQRRKARYGIAAMCVGVGQGAAVLIENTFL
ncbi:thiolase family protein [Taibaiella koreensis]|uniref:thiolase family protein n=1 Tax=Taibaiella koreensis TaxID=1268548 RepID=UPI000E59F787|nr:thiolase family protein [Taibaiella koreensis]